MPRASKTDKENPTEKPEDISETEPAKEQPKKVSTVRKKAASKKDEAKPVTETVTQKTAVGAEKPKRAPRKKAAAKVEVAEKAPAKKKAPEPEAEVTKPPVRKSKPAEEIAAKPTKVKATKKKEAEPEVPARRSLVHQRIFRIAMEKKRRLPEFRRENAHRWMKLNNSWRNVRGNDSFTRQKRKGRIAMVAAGYRTPRLARNIHPSMYIEVPVCRATELEGLDPQMHAIRIGGTVGLRKRQEILKKADAMLLRVLNPGTPEAVGEEELFSELDTEAEKK
ncbi:MAG: 50S ribosomal protein L32e [Candidatus Thorarchaeota archaeon]|nr:MAG: 50S ribosomal protein L32e [Candidatus Thorarchaeota archaeon]